MLAAITGKFLHSPPKESREERLYKDFPPPPNRKMNTSSRPVSKSRTTTNGDHVSHIPPPPPHKSDLTKVISNLQNDIVIKDSMVAALAAKVERLENELKCRGRAGEVASNLTSDDVVRRHHEIQPISHVITDKGRAQQRMGTRGSVCTANALEAIPDVVRTKEQLIAERFLRVFQNPSDYIAYLSSVEFADDLATVCEAVGEVFQDEPRCVFLQSPVYVFGDIHGNLEDLHFFADNIWKLGMDLTAGKFLFLGDYVDRGQSSLECVAYLFGLKLLYPSKIHMLRGNHETRDVNGWEDHYGEKSFLFQCKKRFGKSVGERVWEECNQTFDRMPLSSVIDHEIFCIHGGIPRPVMEYETEVQAILAVPCVAAVTPAYEHETEFSVQVASDCIWSDPASEEMEHSLNDLGFGQSPRGGGAVCFGSAAIDNFLDNNQLSYIIRAHEAHAHGVSLSKGARVFTVFSTSKDHRQGTQAMAGCILVDFDKIQVINRSPKYKNKYVHRRSSAALVNLSPEEIIERQRLGLVRLSINVPDARSRAASINELEKEAEQEEPTAAFNNLPSFKN